MSIDQEAQQQEVLGRSQCPRCAARGKDRSRDNLAEFDDHYHCFRGGCGYHKFKKGAKSVKTRQSSKSTKFKPLKGSLADLADRRIREDTVKRYGYLACDVGGKEYQVANYYKDGELVAQHVRKPGKKFGWRGSARGCELWGQQLGKLGGKRIYITEGEIDAMSVSQVLHNSWTVCSIPSGAESALRSVKDNLEFITSHSEIVLCFDMDDAGKKAAQQVSDILPPGKCKVVHLPMKDANEMLKKGKVKELYNALYEAQIKSPDEILHVSKVKDEKEEHQWAVPFPWRGMTRALVGQRSGEITVYVSGSGSGKSSVTRELALDHLKGGRKVGLVMLEESPPETRDDLISLMMNKRVREIRAQRRLNAQFKKMGEDPIEFEIDDDLDDDEYAEARKLLRKTGLYIYDHRGHNSYTNLMARLEFMAVSLGIQTITVDHITAFASGLSSESGDKDERMMIDGLMADMRGLVTRTGVHIDIVSQLKKTDKAFEEGDRVTLQDIKGAGSIFSVANTVIGLERDRQNKDPQIANTTIMRALKARLNGKSNVVSCLYYDLKTGRMKEVPHSFNEEGELQFGEDFD